MAVLDTWRTRDSAPYSGSPWTPESSNTLRLARLTVGLLVVSLIAPLVTVGLLALALLDFPLSADLPDEIASVEARITRVFDGDGREMAVFRRFESALPMKPEDVPEVLAQAVVASEDRRFFEHEGIDARGLLRALRADASAGEYEQGASTITQQLVRLAYTDDRSATLSRKLREAAFARELESRFSKQEILFKYLSRIYLGSGNYGVAAAAESYFRKPVRELDLSEAALLAGLIPAPSVLDPRINPTGAETQRRQVLEAMRGEGMIDGQQFDRALARPLTLAREGVTPSTAATVVHPPAPEISRYPYFTDYVRQYLIARFGEEKVYTGGLRVETSIDPRLQAAAEASVTKTLQGAPVGVEMALVSLDPRKGLVRALVGGRDFAKSNVNLALGNCAAVKPVEPKPGAPLPPVCIAGGGAGRQPGSAFKPFTLAAALDAGIKSTETYRGPGTYTYPNCSGEGCTVRNTESGSYGSLSLAQATAYSVNTVFAQLILDVGITETAHMANKLGITMVDPEGNLPSGEPYGPSLTLGAAEVSPLDMAAAFGVFSARGQRFSASPVVKVTDPNGKVLEDNTTRRPERVLTQAVADEMNSVLTGGVEFGTGTAANIARPGGTAGKTGTSEGFGDAWFVGYTPELSTSVWMGYADSRQALENIKGTARVYGGTLPAATWKDFMTTALTGVPLSTFPVPGRVVRTTPAVPSSPGPAQSGPSPSTTVDPRGPVITIPQGPGTTLPYVPFDTPPPTLDPLAPYVPPPDPYQPFVPQPYTGTGTP
jgi:penicillin-binding protein 1A